MRKFWKCTVCGYVHEGDNAPAKCPKCDSPAEKFVELSQQDGEKVHISERTNDIHMELVNIAARIEILCEEGIKLDLDPPCVSVFQRAMSEARLIKQRSKAEIEGHMKKGKW